ncbi:MAG: DivIVA domain-containing protein [Actinomycetaceae bacterium]|jgi:DivIVA domain-containing protein|nr:DivIVA domain-containing protein [Actinomycetaceae bacterium]
MSKDTFERVGFFSTGYDPDEVDEFLARAKEAYNGVGNSGFGEADVRNAGFGRARNGYSPSAVDAALDRLEAAFIQRRRAEVVARQGENAWLNETYENAKSLYPRLLRPRGERFANADGWGYSKDAVDKMIDHLAEYFDGKRTLTSSDIREVVFPAAKNAKAYDEGVVDVYFDRALSVLLAVE